MGRVGPRLVAVGGVVALVAACAGLAWAPVQHELATRAALAALQARAVEAGGSCGEGRRQIGDLWGQGESNCDLEVVVRCAVPSGGIAGLSRPIPPTWLPAGTPPWGVRRTAGPGGLLLEATQDMLPVRTDWRCL